MGPPHEPLTFRDVTEAYRREKRSKDITEIRRDFYQAVRVFLDGLRKESEEEMRHDPFSLKALSMGDTLKKARSKTIQIFEMRTEKILLMALRASSGTTVETDKLTREEIAMYNDALDLIASSRSSVLPSDERTARAVTPTYSPAPPLPEEESGAPEAEDQMAPLEEALPPQEGLEQTRIVPSVDEHALDDHLLVRVLEDIPPFAGPERDYVLSREDVVMLPSVIARALVSRGKAVEIKVAKGQSAMGSQ